MYTWLKLQVTHAPFKGERLVALMTPSRGARNAPLTRVKVWHPLIQGASGGKGWHSRGKKWHPCIKVPWSEKMAAQRRIMAPLLKSASEGVKMTSCMGNHSLNP